MKKKIVFFTGAGISAESGISTFRDSNGLWEKYDVSEIATHTAWLRNPDLLTRFYNDLREQVCRVQPNDAHRLIAQLEDDFDVSVITQNVDNLHERAGSKHVLHLHGEIMKLCSSRDKEDERYWQVLEPHQCHVESGTLAGDGSLLRPYIVFFEEAVPNYGRALQIASEADIFVVVGTSLQVTPASYIPMHVPRESQIILIDPKPVPSTNHPHELHIQQPATEGIQQLLKMIQA